MASKIAQMAASDFPTLPTRSLKDFLIPDEAISSDADHSERAEDAAMELSRLSLLGIAGYGFLLKEIAMGNSSGLAACQRYAACLLVGAALLAICTSCALALATRELSIRCSAIQISILRTFAKLENGGWSNDEIETLKKYLEANRSLQRTNLNIAKWTLRVAHIALAVGAIATIISFGLVLLALRPEPEKV